jgi:hypothetical protein
MVTFFGRSQLQSICCHRISAADMSERYPGISGTTHGVRNETSPTANAAVGRGSVDMTILKQSGSMLYPCSCVGFDELLGPFSSGKPRPEWTSFSFHAKLNVEERATQPFTGSPLRYQSNCLRIRRKPKLISIWQLSHTLFQSAQRWSEFFEVPSPSVSIERQAIAGERAFVAVGRIASPRLISGRSCRNKCRQQCERKPYRNRYNAIHLIHLLSLHSSSILAFLACLRPLLKPTFYISD